MKQSELNELIRAITREVLREFKNIDPTSNSSIHQNSDSTSPDKNDRDLDGDVDQSDKNDVKHDVEAGLKNNDFKRKAAETDYQRNLKMVQKYKQVDKPNIKKERDALMKQLRQI